jgi:hypothetical protein
MLKILISYITFPGVIFNQFAHQIVCHLLSVKVVKIVYFDKTGDGYIMYENPDGFLKVTAISLAPLIINSFLAFLFGGFYYLTDSNELISLVILWLGVSFGFHAIPDGQESANVLSASKIALSSNNINPLYYLAYPFYWFLYLVNSFRFILIDLIWAAIFIGIGIELFKGSF